MLKYLAASVLLWSVDALLFPLNGGKDPEPELLFVCPPPSAPQFGSIKCDYSLFDLMCTAQCDAGFVFENGLTTHAVKCDLFKGQLTADVPKCVRTGGTIVTAPSVVGPSTPTFVGPSISGNCVRTLNDCFNRESGDYAYCDNCRQFATCSAAGFYVRDCPGISVFDASVDACTDHIASSLSCKLV